MGEGRSESGSADEKSDQSALEEFLQITPEYQVLFRYLDLVDASNGNAWVTADKPVEVYWPYPAGTSAQCWALWKTSPTVKVRFLPSWPAG